MPKRQKEAENDKMLIIGHILLLEKDLAEDLISTFLTAYKKNKNADFSKANLIRQDLLHILATVIYKANIAKPSNLSSSTQLNIEEPKTYKQAINGPHVQ